MGEVPEALRSSVVLFLSYKDIIICHSVETERGALALSVFRQGIASSALAGIGVGFFSCLLSSADKQRPRARAECEAFSPFSLRPLSAL